MAKETVLMSLKLKNLDSPGEPIVITSALINQKGDRRIREGDLSTEADK